MPLVYWICTGSFGPTFGSGWTPACGRGELAELVESQHLAQLGKIGADRLDVGGERVAPHLGHEEHTDRLRLAEHVRDLGRLEASG